MSLIRDIRLFESDKPNADGFSIPSYIGSIYHYDFIESQDVIHRLLFLLRSRGFSFGDFHHLYVNYTPLLEHGALKKVHRYTIREFAWFKWVDVGCDNELFNSWSLDEKNDFIISTVRSAAELMSPEEGRGTLRTAFDEVMQCGENLILPYKQKSSEDYTVDIMLRINDELDFLPIIQITNSSGDIICKKELDAYGRDAFICQFGTMSLGKRSLRITPRKRYESEYYELKPIKIIW